MMTCSFGAAPSTLVVTPENKLLAGTPGATIMDNIPMKNIPPFAICTSLANPQVAAATAAAQGVLTPMPCVPFVPAPWLPGSVTILVANKPALTDSSKCMCAWGGVIGFTTPGQLTTDIK